MTVSAATPGATIHYTTNGATPTQADTAIASGGTVTVDRSLTLKAAAWAQGYAGSTVAAATYTLVLPPPTLWPTGGTFEGSIVPVTLSSAVAGASIRYTLDGTAPTAASPLYGSPLVITSATTIQARAFRTGWTDSPVATGTYVTDGTTGPCKYTVTPTSIVAPASGRTGYVAVSATGSNCTTWTPASSAEWVTLDTPIFDQWDGFVQRVLADQPIAYWGFHETIGATTALDYTGHGLTATLTRGAAVKTLGLVDLDGVTGRVVVGSSPLFNISNALTVELWLQTTKANARVIGATNDPWELYVGDGGVLELRLLGSVLRGNRIVTDDQGHLVDATWDGSKATLYVDGVLDAQLNVSGTLPASSVGLMIGAHPTRGDYFAGQLQVVTVFDHALTAAQVADRFVWQNGAQSESSGVFGYTIAANLLSPREAVISVTGQSIPVSQAGAPPIITSVSPTSGPAGTQVSIAGSRFGVAQGSGFIWLGSKAGTVVSWSDTQIVTAVATGSVSGTVQVRQGGTASNAVAFAVLTPSITSVTIGGDGTQVTIAGSNFGSSQGAGQVWLGTAAGVVTSWSDTQIVATVAAGSRTGMVQVLQGGVWGTAVPLTVASPPQIAFTTPRSGGVGTVVAIHGTNFGASQGSSVVSVGGASAAVNSWSNTQISVTVPAAATTGVLKVQKDGVWSNAVTFTVPSSTSAPITLTPNVIGLLVGETRAMQSLDAHGAAVTGLTWASSDPTVVSVSTDALPVLTAVGPGTATVTAGGASADVTVYAGSMLPDGAVLWSVPGSGAGNTGLAIAVPNYDAVADVFAIRGNTVQAVTSDGEVAWTAETTSPPGWGLNYFLPDFQGGVVVLRSDQQSIYRLDGLTGQPQPAYAATTDATRSIGFGDPAIHPDGTIFTIEYACHDFCPDYEESTDGAWVVGIDPASGTPKFRVPLVNDVYTGEIRDAAFCQDTVDGPYRFNAHAWPSLITIAGDGYAYLSYRTLKVDGKVERAGEQPFEDGVYDLWEQVVRDVVGTNFVADFPAAQQHLDAMLQLIGPTWLTKLPHLLVEGLASALSTHNRTQAIDYINLLNGLGAPGGFGGYFRRLCDSTSTTVTQFHLLRVGADGSSSDVVVHESSESSTTIALLTPEAPGYHITETEEGPSRVDFSFPNVITNADQGAVYSWKRLTYCDRDSDHGVRSYRHHGPCDATHEHHLTTMAGGAVAADVVWTPTSSPYDPPVWPVLQLEDGSFAGVANSSTVGRALLVFDVAGAITWRLPGYGPVMTTPGGLIAGADASYQAFDASGTAIGQIATIPRYSWRKQAYDNRIGGIGRLAMANTKSGTSYAAVQQGNPSANGTSVGVAEVGELLPAYGLPIRGASCSLGTDKAELAAAARDFYESQRLALIRADTILSQACHDFFSVPGQPGWDARRANYTVEKIVDAVGRQRPFDGPHSTLNRFDAGAMSLARPTGPALRNFESVLRKAPVCSAFVYQLNDPQGLTSITALAQGSPASRGSTPPGDVYISSDQFFIRFFSPATVLHEALHNLTGLDDIELLKFVGPPSSAGKNPISKSLIEAGCAPY